MEYRIYDNWQGRGFRLYEASDSETPFVVQVDGEINGRVFRTIREARQYCEHRFGQTAVRRF